MITSTDQPDFSSQFIIEIYLHHLIEWFALTNLITEFDRKAKHTIRLFFFCSNRETPFLRFHNIHIRSYSNFKNAYNLCNNLCMVYSTIHLHKCHFLFHLHWVNRCESEREMETNKKSILTVPLNRFFRLFDCSIPNELLQPY